MVGKRGIGKREPLAFSGVVDVTEKEGAKLWPE